MEEKYKEIAEVGNQTVNAQTHMITLVLLGTASLNNLKPGAPMHHFSPAIQIFYYVVTGIYLNVEYVS